jgi:2-isopropylmalate synthase
MTPASIGIPRSRMVLGKHSGRHAFEERLSDLGFAFDGERVQTLFDQFKQLADRKKTVSDADIEALARGLETGGQMPERVRLERFNVQSGNVITATSTVRLVRDGATVEHVAAGDGPIDASFRAINHLVGLHPSLEAFSLSAVTGGEDAQGEATVKVRAGERLYNGHGLSTDVIEASIRAYLAALNAILNERPKAGTERP